MSGYADQRAEVNVMARLRPPTWCKSCGYWPPTHAGAHRWDCVVSPPPVTRPQLARLAIIRTSLFDGDRPKWFAWVALNIGRMVDTNSALTRREAMTLIDAAQRDDQ